MVTEKIRREIWHYVIIIVLIIALEGLVSGLIHTYLPFFSSLGIVGNYIVRFLSIGIIFVPSDKILHIVMGI